MLSLAGEFIGLQPFLPMDGSAPATDGRRAVPAVTLSASFLKLLELSLCWLPLPSRGTEIEKSSLPPPAFSVLGKDRYSASGFPPLV